MNRCTAAVPSLTLCVKAQRLLALSFISADIVRLDPSMTQRGCAYGIEFPCDRKKEVRALLSKADLRVTQYIDEGGGAPL